MRNKAPLQHVRVVNEPAKIRATCTSCGATGLVPAGNGGSFNAEHAAKRFRDLGWRIDTNHTGARCPACARSQKEAKMTNKPTTPKPEPTNVVQISGEPPRQTQLTPAQKAHARQLLDSHFDDQLGVYIEDFSDERIAKEIGAPRALVTALREVAYGPLADPLRADLEKLRADIATAQQQFSRGLKDYHENADRTYQALAARLDAIAKSLDQR